MMKKLMSLGLAGILSASLLVGCSSNSKDDDTVTIKYVDENGNVVKKDHVTRKEAKEIERKQQSNDTDKKQTTKEQPKKETSKQHEDSTTEDKHNLDDVLYGNAARGTCPDCGRTAMVFNHGNGLKCAYCGFYDDGYFLDEEPDPSYSDNKDDEDTTEDNSDDYNYDYDDSQDYEDDTDYDDYENEESIENDNDVEESPSETIENN